MKEERVKVLIPAFNEEEYLGDTIHGLLQTISPYQILVIDDGSTDRTGEIARERGVSLLSLPINCGKGEALTQGLKRTQADVILFLDADLGTSSKHILPLLEPILKREVEVTLGLLPPPRKRGGLGVARLVAEKGVRLLRGCHVEGILSGQRAFTREALLKLLPFAPGFGLEVGLTLDMLRFKIPYRLVKVHLYHRETENDWKGFYHRGRQLLHILWALVMKG